jgi:zinc protease
MKEGRRRGFLGLVLCVLASACEVEPPRAPVRMNINLPVTRFVLTNGLEVFVQEDHRTPRVAVNVTYHVGHKDDPPGRGGMAHLVEHLQFTGSEHTARDSFHRTMTDLGAEDINGTTGADITNYFETVPSSSLDATLWIEADRMASSGSPRRGWDTSVIDREKNVVAQELRLRYKNEPNGFRYQLLSRAVYPEGHPYRQSLHEEAEERASTLSELTEFAAKYYTPDNATLMLVGDVTVEQAKEIATRHFGSIQPCAGCRPTRVVPPVEAAALKRMRVIADVDTPMVYVAWPLPAPGEDGFYEVPYALGLIEGNAAAYTEDPDRAQLTMRPRSVGWVFPQRQYLERLGSIGAIYGIPTAKGSVQDLVDGIEIARRDIVAREWAHMSALRSQTISDEVRAIESLGDRARAMQSYRELFGDPSYVMKYLRAFQDVTEERMRAAVGHFFDMDRAAVIIVTPDRSAPRSGKVVEEVKR